MGQQQQQKVNEAAEKFTSALTESFRSIAERTVSAQEINAELTQDFFNSVINNLRAQMESQEPIRQLADHRQRQREATHALTQDSVNAYMDFINFMFSFWQGNVEKVRKQAEQGGVESGAAREKKPWPRYPLFDSGDPGFAERVDEELTIFGDR